jgi:hypothetical protein
MSAVLFPDIGDDRPYFVLMVGEDEQQYLYHFRKDDGDTVMFVFSSAEEAESSLERRINRAGAYLDFMEHFGGHPPAPVRDENWTVGAVTDVETMATLAATVDADVVVLDAGQDPPWRTFRLST